jgi:deoxyribodipyrimidine photo-lyase
VKVFHLYDWEAAVKSVPELRIRKGNDAPVNPNGDFVLYWMIAYRRVNWNYSLDRAVAWCLELKKPLVILEALRCDYQWASIRFHRFIIDGMADNAQRCKKHNVVYYPYVEAESGAGKGLLLTLASKACVVVTDDFPDFFLPRMVAAASGKLPVLLEQIDANGLLPMRAADRVFPTAYAFRRFLQKELPSHLLDHPRPEPFKGVNLNKPKSLPKEVVKGWPTASTKTLKGESGFLGSLPLDHDVSVVNERGGAGSAQQLLKEFLENRLSLYPEKRNEPEAEGTSGLSPYLHFGYISVHHIFRQLMKKENWFFDRLSEKATGSRTGWWGMSEGAEAFLDELITWRELGYNMCWQRDDYDRYETLPDWALTTLKAHEMDERKHIYSLEELERGRTHDPLWNAAQMQLCRQGCVHNYLRMLWGKKILEWSATPQKALRVMIELNNKYALDGRDPNSYSGILWVLGRYDRPWGPERPIYGKVRFMSSKNTARKVHVENYVKKYAP